MAKFGGQFPGERNGVKHVRTSLDRRVAIDGSPLVRLNCYPGNLPLSLITEAERGWAGYGGKVDLQN